MFDRIRRPALSTVDAERLKLQAAEVGAVLADASVHAGKTAAHLAEQAKDATVHAKAWATPRVEKALRDGARAAAPKVERAAERAVPIVDEAHDKLVDELLPKLVAAITAAAAAAAAGADRARDAADAKLTEIAHIAVPEPKKSHTGAKVFWLFAGLAAIGAAFAAWRAGRPTTDPWAEEPWEPTAPEHGSDRFKARAGELGGVVSDVKHEIGDAAEAVGEAAGETVARTREATEKAAERAREATERAREAAEKARESAKKAAPRRRATTASTTTTDGSNDVTEKLPTTGETGTAPGATDAPLDRPDAHEPLDSEKIPTDVPGQAGDPLNTAKNPGEGI